MIRSGKASWENMTTGFTAKSDPAFNSSHCNYYTIDELYGRANDTSALSAKQKVTEEISRANTIEDFKRLRATMAIIEYIDTSETESTLISMSHKLENVDEKSTAVTGTGGDVESEGEDSPGSGSEGEEGAGTAAKSSRKKRKQLRSKKDNSSHNKIRNGKQYTHVEIHPSLLMGVMGNQICFPENNPVARNVFGCGQAKQAASLYHSNYQVRIDKMGVVINNGEVPIVKSRYLDLINHEEHPCGFNAVVAIMSFNGYNVEDSILFNEASIKRGMFRITYYNMYESREESSSVRGNQRDTRFADIQKEGAIGIKPGYDYSYLDSNGLIRENTEMDDKKVVIGVGSVSIQNDGGQMRDMSIMPKKGQLGFVDKAFMTEGETGFRLAKVRIREERFPSIGDKFCSRCGQKGTCGLIIPEQDMPFTKDGIRPDIIINPHAIPTRMTIGQLIESLMGKACVMHGSFGNCTAYTNNGTKHESFGSVLTNYGFHSSGTEVLYNGMTGEQVKSDIYIGPTYYMRLKQMVKDKINYRSKGPRTQLTRQTVQGRANDGGLRVGEMERDGILGHGAAHFLNESLMVRGDEYNMAVCNKSGMIAIYNPNQNLFMSPMVDGPIQYSGNIDESGGGSVIQMSKFGRSFSIVRIPYCLKLLMQELIVMNVQMRIITDDNIDQLPSMSYSNNIYKVLKDSRGEMGVDDIIEKNRLAAGLKPSVRRGQAGPEEGEDEAGIGSRVYLPSRSEEEMNEWDGSKLSRPDVFSDVDPAYLSAIDKLTFDIDIDTKERIHNFGWRFAVKSDIIKQLKENMKKQTAANVSQSGGEFEITSLDDLTGEDLVLESIILDKNGEPTELWSISGSRWDGDYPSRFPDGWLSEMLVYTNGEPISPSDMIEELRKIRKPLNWITAIISLIDRYIRKNRHRDTMDPDTVILTENDKNIQENAREIRRITSEIDRAKREGNVAEEEQLKVQLARLTDERTTLNEARRQIEREIEDRKQAMDTYVPSSPMYTSSSPRENEEQELRSAVSSFNAKMIENAGNSPDDISVSDSSEPRTPSTPGYTSMWQDGGSKTNRFIPQIPVGVLDGYLNSKRSLKHGMNSNMYTNSGQQIQNIGGGNMNMNNMNMNMHNMHNMHNMNNSAVPTMNVPLVATMPMTMNMPIMSGGGGGGNGVGNNNGQAINNPIVNSNQSQQNNNTSTTASDGVRTLSIKL